jgi:hypothetical protein
VARSKEGFLIPKLAVGLLWLNFAFLWWRVYHITTIKDVTDSLTYLGDLLTVYALLVAIWVIHNIRIYRHKGPRLRPKWVGFSSTHDCLNQQINRDVDVEHEQEIIVDVIRAEKFFRGNTGTVDEPALTTSSHSR